MKVAEKPLFSSFKLTRNVVILAAPVTIWVFTVTLALTLKRVGGWPFILSQTTSFACVCAVCVALLRLARLIDCRDDSSSLDRRIPALVVLGAISAYFLTVSQVRILQF